MFSVRFSWCWLFWRRYSSGPAPCPPPEPESPTQHLEDRKAAIYENLRDLQGEYHMGKLSDDDYQETKLDLQKELAGVLAQIEAIESGNATTETSAEAAG